MYGYARWFGKGAPRSGRRRSERPDLADRLQTLALAEQGEAVAGGEHGVARGQHDLASPGD